MEPKVELTREQIEGWRVELERAYGRQAESLCDLALERLRAGEPQQTPPVPMSLRYDAAAAPDSMMDTLRLDWWGGGIRAAIDEAMREGKPSRPAAPSLTQEEAEMLLDALAHHHIRFGEPWTALRAKLLKMKEGK